MEVLIGREGWDVDGQWVMVKLLPGGMWWDAGIKSDATG